MRTCRLALSASILAIMVSTQGCETMKRPRITQAWYQSPRGIGRRDVTAQLQEQCRSAVNGCIVDCDNTLAGDPDFGYVKSCLIQYSCAGEPRELHAIEMTPTRLSCK